MTVRRALVLTLLWVAVSPRAASALSDYIPVRPDGVLASSPAAAAARGDPALTVVVRGTDNSIYLTRSSAGLGYGPWQNLGAPPGGAIGDPAVFSWAPGRLDIFVRGVDNRLWQLFRPIQTSFIPTEPFQSDWFKPVGDDGVLASGPAVSSRGPGRLDLFVRGTDGQVYERFYDGTWNNAWLPQGAPPDGVSVVGEPASASGDTMRVDLFVRGTDNELWTKWYDGTRWTAWARPVSFPAVLTSSPAAVSGGPQQVVVFARGADANMWSTEGNGTGPLSWRGWLPESVGGANPIKDRPAATGRGLSQIDVFVRGTDDRSYQFHYAPPALPPPPPGPPIQAVALGG